jgi:hypothetical protein
MSLKGAPRFMVQLEAFQPQGSECFAVSLFALGPFLIGAVEHSHVLYFTILSFHLLFQ